MKTLLSTLFLLSTIGAFAQHGQIRQAQANHSQGYHHVHIVSLTDVDPEFVGKLWADYMKSYSRKTKKIKRTTEWFSDDATIKELSNNTVDVYANAVELTTGVDFHVWFDLGGAYLNAQMHQELMPATQTILKGFANLVEREKLALLLKTQEDELKQFERTLSDLEKAHKEQEKTLEAKQEEVKQAEMELDRLAKEQKTHEALIKTQQEIIGETKRTMNQLKKQ